MILKWKVGTRSLAPMYAILAVSASVAVHAGEPCVPHADNTLAPLGGGTHWVIALAEFDGDLIASRAIMETQTLTLDRWDADSGTWQLLGDGVAGLTIAIGEFDGDLIAAGDILEDPDAGFISRWDGSMWHPLGSADTFNGGVVRMAVLNGDLVVMGDFTTVNGEPGRLARWNGKSWQAIGGNISTSLAAMTVYNGDVIVAGGFSSINGVPANRIARWDGSSWHALGSGLQNPGGLTIVSSLAEYNGDLIVGGAFTIAGGEDATCLARWDGTNWHAIGSGTNGPVTAITSYDGELIVGGVFDSAGGILTNAVARWDGTESDLQGIGDACPGLPELGCGISFVFDRTMPPPLWDMTVHNGQLIIGGLFPLAFGVPTNGIIGWDGCMEPSLPVGDLDGNGVVNVADLLDLLAAWGRCADVNDCPADLDEDGTVGVSDLLILLAHWG